MEDYIPITATHPLKTASFGKVVSVLCQATIMLRLAVFKTDLREREISALILKFVDSFPHESMNK